jgi:hypothetical protein
MQAMESGKPLARNFLNQPIGLGNGMLLGESHNPQKVGKFFETIETLI